MGNWRTRFVPLSVRAPCAGDSEPEATADDWIVLWQQLHDDTGDPDDRTRLWRGAIQIVRHLIERNGGGPIEILDGPDVLVIPKSFVRWVKLHDPESARTGTEMGFRIGEEVVDSIKP